MSTLTYPSVVTQAVSPPIQRIREVLAHIAASGRTCVPGLPEQIVVLSASDRDTVHKKTSFCGEANPSAKLVECQVRDILAAGRTRTIRSLAAEFGVSVPTITAIKSRRLWRHLQ